jgi:NAD(P)-dependent dehydrogenase (short-subunit alcohol dehydrogenase family)
MRLAGKVAVVTGGGNGIGRALCRRFALEGAKAVVVADVNGVTAAQVADEIGGTAITCDVAREADVVALVAQTIARHQAIDLFCSNAGIAVNGGEQTPDAEWARCWDVNVMAHVYAARAVIPHMLERGGGYLLQTASAAGLLTQLGSAPYSVTKHAALALAEWLAITYGDAGLRVSVLAPQAVRTAMTAGVVDGGVAGVDGMLEPDQVADAVIDGLDAESFLILPHPEVLEYFRRKASDYERWLNGMRRLQTRFGGAGEPA